MKWPKISEWDQPSTQSNGGDLTSYWHIWDYCRRVYSELEAKYEAHVGMHNWLTDKGGAAASGAPAGADDGRREDPARRRSYNVRKYQGYPRPPSPPSPYADPPPPRGHVECRTAKADDHFCRTCGDPRCDS